MGQKKINQTYTKNFIVNYHFALIVINTSILSIFVVIK